MLPKQIVFTILLHFYCYTRKTTTSAFLINHQFSHHLRKESFQQSRRKMSASENPFKRAKIASLDKSTKIIGTHSGTFQADEALGVWLLRQVPDYFQSRVIRSRDNDVLNKLDIVLDVGGVYDHDNLRYDHHQRGYDERFDAGKKEGEPRCSKLSASGLIYRHYGKEVIAQFYPNLSQVQLDLAYNKMYDSFMEPIDAIDTGVEMIPSDVNVAYKDRTGLASRVSRLNPRWNEIDSEGNFPDPDERFSKASEMCGEDFLGMLAHVVESDIPAKEFVEKALLKRMDVDASGEIIAFKSGGLPWRNHLYDLEKEHKVDPLVKFVLYTDQSGMWRVQAVTVEGTLFENRLSLPEEWRGVRDEELASIAGIPGCKFCHAAGFIGGNETFEGALEMAKVALSKKE